MGLFDKLFGKPGSTESRTSDSSRSASASGVGARTGLDNPAAIDLISISPDGNTIMLHLVAGEPWDADGKRAMQLQAKLKNYVAFAADGQLARQYPDSRGKHVMVRIDTHHPLGDLEQRLVAAVRESWCTPSGIKLVVEPL